jgi:CheY-like chemotaxis protein
MTSVAELVADNTELRTPLAAGKKDEAAARAAEALASAGGDLGQVHAEERVMNVRFSDICGFTGLSGAMAPRDVIEYPGTRLTGSVPMSKLRVLVVDDSLFMRAANKKMIENDPRLEIAGTTKDGAEAVEQVDKLKPDVVTMDFNMPRMDGAQAVREIMRRRPTPVVMLSAHTRDGARETFEALAAGAVDFLTKPSGEVSADFQAIGPRLLEKIHAAAGAVPREITPARPPRPRTDVGLSTWPPTGPKVVIVGVSTGGPTALTRVIPAIPSDCGSRGERLPPVGRRDHEERRAHLRPPRRRRDHDRHGQGRRRRHERDPRRRRQDARTGSRQLRDLGHAARRHRGRRGRRDHLARRHRRAPGAAVAVHCAPACPRRAPSPSSPSPRRTSPTPGARARSTSSPPRARAAGSRRSSPARSTA